MPDVPTFAESGLAGYEVNGWYGVLAPTRTPRATIAVLDAALRQSLNDPDTRARFATVRTAHALHAGYLRNYYLNRE